MKMKMKGGFIEDDASIDGLFACTMKYEIKSTKATIDWTGPKIPLDEWNQVLSFFQWCYDKYKSECQVRLFVSPTLQTWKAYAFPQEAKTGMTAHELDNEEKNRQRAALNLNPPDWYYFGTVHHHCSAQAFQSGTDENNEKDQDGLHITIGKMNEKENYDIHARFYRKGLVLQNDNLDMSWFVDTSAILAECPQKFRPYLPKDWADKQARRLLTKVPTELVFPEQWAANVIEIKPVVTTYTGSSVGQPGLESWRTGNGVSTQCPSQYSAETEPMWKRVDAAWKEIVYRCVQEEIKLDDLEQALGDMAQMQFAPYIICQACRHHKVDPDDLERQGPIDLERDMAEEALHQQKAKEDAKLPKSTTNEANGSGERSGGEDPVGGIGEDPYSHIHGL